MHTDSPAHIFTLRFDTREQAESAAANIGADWSAVRCQVGDDRRAKRWQLARTLPSPL